MRTVGDLFCGAGGFSTGFEQAGFKIKWGVDNWNKAIDTFHANHADAKCWLNDIREVNGKDLGYVDIIIGGPECQQFSTANQNPDIGKGLELVSEFFRIVREVKPKYWILENVPPLREHIMKWKNQVQVKTILNYANFGVPQARKRLFAGKFTIPRPTHSKTGGTTLDGKVLRSWIGWAVALKLDLDDSVELVPNVGEKIHRTYQRNLGRKPHEPSQTLNTACPPRIYTVEGRKKVRSLSIEESIILQGFPTDYKFIGDRCKLIGNSVSPIMSKAIAEALRWTSK